MADFKNTFSWSHSRMKTFRECLRKYYWAYYGFWNGWRHESPETARLAYRLKQIQPLAMWAGGIVHDVIEHYLSAVRAGQAPPVESLQEEARRLLNRGWHESIKRQWLRDPKRRANLFEHYYEQTISKEEREALRERVFSCLDYFTRSEALARIQAVGPNRWVALEDFDTFEVEGCPIWVKLDIGIREDDDSLLIIDWKTGEAYGEDREQLNTYALYSLDKWKTPPERVRQRLVYLKQGEEVVSEADPSALIEHRDSMMASIAEMRALLADAENNVAEMDAFAMTTDENKCLRCNFRELCYGRRDGVGPAPARS